MCLFKLRCIDFSEVTCEKKGSTRDPDFDFPDHDNFNFLANVRKKIAHHDDNSNLERFDDQDDYDDNDAYDS